MHRVLVLLLTLAFLPALCHADTINYQINVTGTWIETNPSCVLNCTETMKLSYEFESNLEVFNPNSPTAGIYGWVPMNTMQVTASGFLGSFAFLPSFNPVSGLWEDDNFPSADGIPFFNAQMDEIDLGVQGPGLSGRGGPDLFIHSCNFSNDCVNAYPGVFPLDIMANNTTSTAVRVPAFDSAWELLLVSAIFCTFGLFVKHRSA
jgi:hypothetical protein